MNICKICGQPCGIYEICRECQSAQRMKILYKRNKFLSDPLEKKVYTSFQINSYLIK